MLTVNEFNNFPRSLAPKERGFIYIIYIIFIIFILLILVIIYLLWINCDSFNNKILYKEYFNNKSLKNKYYSMKSGKKEKSLINKINEYRKLY